MTALMSHEEFRATDSFAELCHDWGLDPARPLEDQRLTVEDAGEFWDAYGSLRAACSLRSAADVAEQVTGLIRCAQGVAGALSLIDRYGYLIAVQDESGQAWMIPVQRADETQIADAMIAVMTSGENGPSPC